MKPLSDYLVAGPGARKGIVKRQKQKPGFSGRYYAAYAAAEEFLTGHADAEALLSNANELRGRAAQDGLEAERNVLNAEAIEHLVRAAGNLPLAGVIIAAGENDPEKLLIGGVNVSVRPEFILRARSKAGNDVVGALKLCFTKTEALGENRGAYVAATVQQYVEEKLVPHSSGLVAPSRELSLVLDVFTGNVYNAPKAVKKRRADIMAACEEIARYWDDL